MVLVCTRPVHSYLAYKYDPGALGADEVEIKISHCRQFATAIFT